MNEAIEEFEHVAAAQLPETYYETRSKEYWVLDAHGDWMGMTESQYKRILKAHGFSDRTPKGGINSPQDRALLQIQQERNVQYVGSLAGWMKGRHDMNGTRALVTTSPRILEPVPGDCAMLKGLFEQLLSDMEGVQIPYFFAWLKLSYESLRAGQIRPGQVVVFVGTRNSGKSLGQNLITEMLGGRCAKPYQVLTGGTAFNSDLFAAENLIVEDESPSTDIRSRRAFGQQIKGITVNEWQRLHGKHKDPVTLKPFWRMTVSLNDEDENILVLPPIDPSIEDKVMIFRVTTCRMPMPTRTQAERAAFREKLSAEIPAFLDFLVNWEIPEELHCERFGVKHFHHPEVLAILNELAPESRLLDLIDYSIFGVQDVGGENRTEITMTAEQIQGLLTGGTLGGGHEARSLLKFSNTCGTYLGRLAKTRSDRVKCVRTATTRKWRISAPPGEGGPPSGGMTPCFACSTKKNEIHIEVDRGAELGDMASSAKGGEEVRHA